MSCCSLASRCGYSQNLFMSDSKTFVTNCWYIQNGTCRYSKVFYQQQKTSIKSNANYKPGDTRLGGSVLWCLKGPSHICRVKFSSDKKIGLYCGLMLRQELVVNWWYIQLGLPAVQWAHWWSVKIHLVALMIQQRGKDTASLDMCARHQSHQNFNKQLPYARVGILGGNM